MEREKERREKERKREEKKRERESKVWALHLKCGSWSSFNRLKGAKTLGYAPLRNKEIGHI